jgi:hypothetical protein
MAHVFLCCINNLLDRHLSLLVNPVEGSRLVGVQVLRLEPEGNLLLGVLDAVGAVADVTSDILHSLAYCIDG